MNAIHSDTRLNRSAFSTTETELNVIAALAILGLSSNPNQDKGSLPQSERLRR